MNYDLLNNNEYNKLVGYTISVLRAKNYTHIDGRDIVQDAFLMLHHSQLDYSFDSMRKCIYQSITGYVNQLCDINTAGMVQKKKQGIFAGIEMKPCKCCGGLLPVSFFYINRKYPDGLITYATDCKECAKKKSKEAKYKKLADPIYHAAYIDKQAARNTKKSQIISNNPRLKEAFRAIWRGAKRSKAA